MAEKVISRGEMVILAIVILAILSFALQKCGINVVNTTEESEIIHKPHGDR